MNTTGTSILPLLQPACVCAAVSLSLLCAGCDVDEGAVTAKKSGTTAVRKSRDYVVLLHGISRSPRSMRRIETALAAQGYSVINFGYPSTRESIEEIAANLHMTIGGIPPGKSRIHFVTHSLGSIVVRYYLHRYRTPRLGRIVMIAPPNRGSQLARHLSRWKAYRQVFGRAGEEVTGAPGTIPQVIPPPKAEFGIIAGGLGFPLGLNPFLPGDNDGTVSVEETKLPGMKDFILLRGQHSLLLLQGDVIRNIVQFLKEGCFIR
ncbi:MAG: alpha/beta hydrolase [Spirochaetes bacterium]|nr:alpha/beta hydrolase [Spirochaetota bacterium]